MNKSQYINGGRNNIRILQVEKIKLKIIDLLRNNSVTSLDSMYFIFFKKKQRALAYVATTGITMLLTAYTSMCMGRSDLIRSPTAFSRIKPTRNL